MSDTSERAGTSDLPDWVPEAARNYLSHVESGRSIRALARQAGVHASTILRQVRRIETRREDPLVDAAISALAALPHPDGSGRRSPKDDPTMSLQSRSFPATPAEAEIDREGRRILRRMQEPGAVMAVAPEMEKAVVVRDTPDGRTVRTAVLDRNVAQAMALKDWIEPTGTGRIQRYRITAVGRAALKRLMAAEESARAGFAEAQQAFAGEDNDRSERAAAGQRRIATRYNAAESPVAALARRRDRDGIAFLSDELLAAAERLREDFELAQLGPKVTQNWERLVTGSVDADGAGGGDASFGHGAARNRVAAALRELGPGLGDVALRCCCFLEGLEVAEKRMGWSSRSAKIVLRIALQRLRRHYEETGGMHGVLIG
jgi:hypothetical protein